MEEKRLPRKFLAIYASNPWPIGRPQSTRTTNRAVWKDGSHRLRMTHNCGNNGEESSRPI
eukprot:3345597-Ditylum_brightwellii.AAC.1